MTGDPDGTCVRLLSSDSYVTVASVTRARVRDLLETGASVTEIADTLGLAKSTVCYHVRRLGYAPDPRFAARYDWKAIASFYEQGHSVTECMRHFGFSMSAWVDAIASGRVTPRPRAIPAEAFLSGARTGSRGQLKRRLLVEGLKEEQCERCGTSEWRGRALSLALHHLNGDPIDNRLENLQLLCPNCHAQTPNFSGRNRRIRRLNSVTRALASAGAVPFDRGSMRRLPLVGEAS
jgi:DNA-binding transcriptional ArsR family regulator